MIQVIHRAFNILEFLAQDPTKEFSLSEIVENTGLNPATCANILKTMMNRNYVEQTGPKKGYQLSYMAYHLTQGVSYDTILLNMTKSILHQLRDDVNEGVLLAVVRGNKRVILYEVPSNHEILARARQESTAYRATTGRAILANYTPQEIETFINQAGLPIPEEWPGIATREELLAALEQIHQAGILVTVDQNHVAGVAVPLLKNGMVIASIGIYLPDIRFGTEERAFIINRVKAAAEQINALLNNHK